MQSSVAISLKTINVSGKIQNDAYFGRTQTQIFKIIHFQVCSKSLGTTQNCLDKLRSTCFTSAYLDIVTESCMFGFVRAFLKLPNCSRRPLAFLWSSVLTSRFCQSAVLQVPWEKTYLCFVHLKYPCGEKCQFEVGQFQALLVTEGQNLHQLSDSGYVFKKPTEKQVEQSRTVLSFLHSSFLQSESSTPDFQISRLSSDSS